MAITSFVPANLGDYPSGNRRRLPVDSCFALIIPALNEEDAIGSTLANALAACGDIITKTPVRHVYVVFVNDGSTDRTQEIADTYNGIVKIRFAENKGYGAAIKAGFQATNADIVGFMDADGTCDPRFCIDLINALFTGAADIAVGSRMNSESEMPFVRRLGNYLFARLIGAISGQKLTDSASGMRVLRRSCLQNLHPLPDGLHFTPAMTCLALMDPRLKIIEVPMPYKERTGQSKLRVVKDGFRFLFIILFTAALFNPIKSLAALGFLFLLCGAIIGVTVGLFQESTVVIVTWCGAFVVVWLQAVFVGFLSHQALHMLIGPWNKKGFGESMLQRYFWTSRMVRAGVIIMAFALALFVAHLFVPPPWGALIAMASACAVVLAGWTALAGVILRVIWAAKERRIAERENPFAQTVSSLNR